MSQKIKTQEKFDLIFILKRDILYNSMWVNKFAGKLIKQGKKHLIEKSVNKAFTELKFTFKKLPGFLLVKKIVELRPLLTYVNKRLGRKYHSVPFPIKERRQQILSLNAIVKLIKNFDNHKLNGKIISILSNIFGSKKSYIVKQISDDVKHLTDSRIYLYLRW